MPKKPTTKKPGSESSSYSSEASIAKPTRTSTTRKPAKKAAPKEVEVKVKMLPLEEAQNNKVEKYYEAVGRRKESIARVRLYTKKATDTVDPSVRTGEEKALITVNGKNYRDYFSDAILWGIVESPLRKLKSVNRFKATVVVHGGGKSGQADAIKHGIARTLVDFDSNFRKKLKKSGYLTRDPRAKERRKYGLKKARKAPRWAKR